MKPRLLFELFLCQVSGARWCENADSVPNSLIDRFCDKAPSRLSFSRLTEKERERETKKQEKEGEERKKEASREGERAFW